jgi:hypothetical protein
MSAIFAEISIDGRNRSTAWPPVLRNVGARSTTVASKPDRVSQYASTGPAMLAPEMRIRIAHLPAGFRSATQLYDELRRATVDGALAALEIEQSSPG